MKHIKQMHPLLQLALSATLFIVVLMGLQNLLASVRVVRRAARFESMLQGREFAVVLFYHKGKRIEDKALRAKMRQQLKNFKAASKTAPYRYAGVDFYSVDVARQQDLADIATKYRAMPSANQVSVALFRGGDMVSTKRGMFDRADITDFIDQYLGKEIDKVVDEKDRALVRAKEDAKRRAYDRSYRYPYWGYYGYGWPYYRRWWWGGPYYGGGWGFGWRGGWRGGRRCHRCH